MKKKVILTIILGLIIIILAIFFIRALSIREIDDIHPDIPCEKEYVNQADILWVIPEYNGKSIADNKTWCDEIKSKGEMKALWGPNDYPELYLSIGYTIKSNFRNKSSRFNIAM